MKLFDGSRYWQNAFAFLLLVFGFSAYVVHVAGPEQVSQVVGPLTLMLGTACTTLFGVMGLVKRKQSEADSQQAYASRLQVEAQLTRTPTPPAPAAHVGPAPTAPRSDAHGAEIEPPASRGRP